jgi:hypothetical protein
MSKPDILAAIANKYGKKPTATQKRKSALMFCFLALRLLPFNGAVAAGNK